MAMTIQVLLGLDRVDLARYGYLMFKTRDLNYLMEIISAGTCIANQKPILILRFQIIQRRKMHMLLGLLTSNFSYICLTERS